jgi:hypothetical protein
MSWETPKTDWFGSTDIDGVYTGDRFNASDFNRIKNNIEFIWDIASSLYEGIESIQLWDDRTPADYFYADEMNALVHYVESINSKTLEISHELWRSYADNGSTMTFDELNRLEQLEFELGENFVDQFHAGSYSVGSCRNISITEVNRQFQITWSDPNDIVFGEETLATWDKTVLVRKEGSFPTSPTDGTVVVTNTVRNQYSTTPYTDTDVVVGTYYYKLFPISTDGIANDNPVNNVTGHLDYIIVASAPSQSGTLTYNGGSQAPTWINYDPNALSISGATSGQNAGTYTTTFTLKPAYQWWDGTLTPKNVSWSIGKAAGNLAIDTTTMSLLGGGASSGIITVTRSGDGAISAISSNTNVATVSVTNNIVTVTAVGHLSGSATVTISVAEGTNYTAPANKTCAVTSLGYIVVPILPSQSGTLTYTGSDQSPTWSNYNTDQLTIGGDTSAQNAGSYTVTFILKPGYQWWDHTIGAKTTEWSIGKADGSLSISPTTLLLSSANPSGDITVTRLGDGVISAISSNASIVTTSVNGNVVTASISNTVGGEVTITVSVAEGTNYTAPSSKTCDVTSFFNVIFGVSIDLTNPDPFAAVTYTDDAIGMTPGGDDWDDMPIFSSIKPCVFTEGLFQYYLDPNDYSKKIDGTDARILDGDDVMVEIPKIGFKINTVDDVMTVTITNATNDDNFEYYAHTRETRGDRDKLYIGAYHGSIRTSTMLLISQSGDMPDSNRTIGSYRTMAQRKGEGYDLLSFYQVVLLQCLFIIKYKNLNSQVALGRGKVSSSGSVKTVLTGGTDKKGMYFGSTSYYDQVKCFGIEDLWGNVYDFIDGLYVDSDYNILTAYKDFNNTGDGYSIVGSVPGIVRNDYISKVYGTTACGFIPTETSGSESTYYSDWGFVVSNRIGLYGGSGTMGDGAGIFSMLIQSATTTNTGYGARLMFL